MHSTGIEPVSTPWKGAILPLNYKCFCVGLPHSYRRLFLRDLNAVGTMCLGRSRHDVPWTPYGGHPAAVPPAPPAPPVAVPVLRVTQLSPFVTPSHVTF